MQPGPTVALQFAFSITAYSLIAAWYLWPILTSVPLKSALPPLILVHLVRPISMWMLVPGVIVGAGIPAGFATGTAYGDLAAASLALLAAVMARKELPFWRVAVWVFNGWGAFDALKNVVVGALQDSPAQMGAGVLIPAYGVPALLVSHALVFLLLLRRQPR
jgi:hypothetical protein